MKITNVDKFAHMLFRLVTSILRTSLLLVIDFIASKGFFEKMWSKLFLIHRVSYLIFVAIIHSTSQMPNTDELC